MLSLPWPWLTIHACEDYSQGHQDTTWVCCNGEPSSTNVHLIALPDSSQQMMVGGAAPVSDIQLKLMAPPYLRETFGVLAITVVTSSG